jgi:hypothetical protein
MVWLLLNMMFHMLLVSNLTIFEFSKALGDRCDLGFDNDASSSKDTTINQGKIIFVPPVCLDNPSPRNEDKRKASILIDLRLKTERKMLGFHWGLRLRVSTLLGDNLC